MKLRQAAQGELWAISDSYLSELFADVEIHAAAKPQRRVPRVSGGVAILPIHGMITQRGSIWQDMLGGTSTQAFEAAFSRAIASDRISAVVLDIDSPGGTTPGVEEASDRVFAARGTKPIIAVANSLAASAAYWIGSQADSFIAAPGADVGSVGVFRMHEDHSEALAAEGVKVTLIAQPPRKVEGNPFAPLDDEALAHQQEQVKETYAIFQKHVKRARGVSNTGDGRSFHARQAASMGLVDSVASMVDTLGKMGVGAKAQLTQADSQLTQELCSVWDTLETQGSKSTDIRRRRLALAERDLTQ